MNSYNVLLKKYREERNLTIKELSKKVHISRLSLYFYECGYFRPSKKHLEKLENFFNEKISLEGLDAYPAPLVEKSIKMHNDRLFVKRIVFGVLSFLMAASVVTGALLFKESITSGHSKYGTTYTNLREEVKKKGTQGHDIVTGLEYYRITENTDPGESTIIFYKTDSILYINECSYSSTIVDATMGISRVHFIFGGGLGSESNICSYSFGSVDTGTYFTCEFYYNNQVVTSINNLKILVQGHNKIDEQVAISIINQSINEVETSLSTSMSKVLNKTTSFYNDFLPAREKGRTINFALQLSGLILIVVGIVLFFIFLAIFTKLMFIHIKPRLVESLGVDEVKKKKPLPEDVNMNVGIPDAVLVVVGEILGDLSVLLIVGGILVGFLEVLGIINIPASAKGNDYLFFIKVMYFSGVFINHFATLGRHKKPDGILKNIVGNLFLFLIIASIETASAIITSAWDYDLNSIIYQNLPGNIYNIIAIHYLIYLFLFFQPPFLNKKNKIVRGLWHSLSLIPLAFLVVSYIISDSYSLVYGVKENVYIDFWFPSGFLSLSVVTIAFMFTMFGLNIYYEKKYGLRNAQIFTHGDRYTLVENSICAIYIVIIGLVDFLFINNQYGYYLGLGQNYWIFYLLPFVMLCKHSPSLTQTILLGKDDKVISREIS